MKKQTKLIICTAVAYLVMAMITYGYTYKSWEPDAWCIEHNVTAGFCGEGSRISKSVAFGILWPGVIFSTAFHHVSLFMTRWP